MAKKIKHVPSDFSKPKLAPPNSRQGTKSEKKPRRSKRSFENTPGVQRPGSKPPAPGAGDTKDRNFKSKKPAAGKKIPRVDQPSANKRAEPLVGTEASKTSDEKIPLNKFIAHCGISSRREAGELIKKGKVKVNGVIETEPGKRVSDEDFITYEGKRVLRQKKFVYYLLNKPKNVITTLDDPEERKTVLDLFKDVDTTRLYPVGRLDRNTTGLLLLTNDGDLAQRLSHPKYNIRKIYQVRLDKPLLKQDMELIAKGVVLEDGPAPVDEVAYIDPKDKKEIGIEIHSGRNRIVRRIFEHLHYKVMALDRVMYAGLTKKNIPRGKWRALDEKEVIYLKHFRG